MARVEGVSQAAWDVGILTVATSLGLFFYSKVRRVQSIGRMPLNVKSLGSVAAIGSALALLGSDSKLREIRKSKRLEILEQTQKVCNQGYYLVGDKRVQLDPTQRAEMQKNTTVLTRNDLQSQHASRGPKLQLLEFRRWLQVQDKHTAIMGSGREDPVEQAARIKKKGGNPVLINLGNRTEPGGGYARGAGGQEEELCRRSDLSYALDPQYNPSMVIPYQVPETGVIYTPGVTFMRGSESEDYPFLAEPIQVAVMTSSFDNCGEKEKAGEIETQLEVAANQGHDCVVVKTSDIDAYLAVWKERKQEGILTYLYLLR